MAAYPTPTGILAARVEGGMDIPINHGIETASSTWKAGAPLIFASGKLAISTAPIDATDMTVGFSLTNATGTTDHDTIYVPALANVVFIGWLLATSGGASLDTHVLAQTDVGTTHAIQTDSASGKWYVDYSNTSDKAAYIVGLVDAIGTVGRVYFKVINAATPY